MRPVRLVAGFLTVGLWTLLSRVFGFVRDILIAAYLGAGPAAEAFLIAFALPNMFRRFFAEGAFNMAFVPMFSKKVQNGENPERFAQDAFSGLATVLILLTLAAQLFMPWLVLATASGFAGDVRFDLAVGFGRIAFAYILFVSLAALLSGVLNSLSRFAAAAAAPVLLNVILIATLLIAEAGIVEDLIVIEAVVAADVTGGHHGTLLAWGVFVAGIAQMALVWWAAAREGFALRPTLPRLTPEMRRLAVIAAPAMLAGGVVQVNLLIGRQVASHFEGAVAWLGYADRLYQLPLGVVAIAIGVVLLPDLSRRLSVEDTEGGRDAFNRAGEFSLMLTVPAAVALVVIPVPLISVLFERGAFGSDDTVRTAVALAIYGLGLPAFVLQKVLQPLFFAREDTKSPFRYAVVALIINAVIAIGLAPVIGFYAAALGTTLAGWGMMWLLWFGSRKMGPAAQLDARAMRRVPRIVVASVLMGVVLWVGNLMLAPMFGRGGLDTLALVILIVLGMVSYFGMGQLIGAFRLSEFRRALRRQP